MEHYVCTGECKGVSERAKVCETADCSKKGEPLANCSCFDNSHAEAHQPGDHAHKE